MATVQIRVGPKDRGRSLTLAEFLEAERRVGYRYELARGILEVTNIPGIKHWQVLDNLHECFSRYRREYPRVIRLIGHGSEVRYVIPELETERHPDLALLFHDAPVGFEEMPLSVLGMEIVSRGTRSRRRDYVDKRLDYLAVGLLEYWIADPEERRVTILARAEVGGVPTWTERIFRGEEAIVSGLLPGFDEEVSGLWMGLA